MAKPAPGKATRQMLPPAAPGEYSCALIESSIGSPFFLPRIENFPSEILGFLGSGGLEKKHVAQVHRQQFGRVGRNLCFARRAPRTGGTPVPRFGVVSGKVTEVTEKAHA